MRTHVVANMRARGLARDPKRLGVLSRICAGRATIHASHELSDLDAVMREILDERPDCVVLAGGDGTFMNGISALGRAFAQREQASARWPQIGLLPLGTVGTISRNWGARGRPEAILERWLSRPETLRSIPRPTLEIDATTREGVRRSIGFIFGTGLIAKFFETYEARGARGLGLAAQIAGRVFVESLTGGPLAQTILTPMPCLVRVGGAPVAERVSLLCASVLRDLGLGMRVCYRAGELPDQVHLVASSLPPAELGPRAPRVLLGRSIGGRGHFDALVPAFSVEFPGGVEGPYVFDGDTFSASRLDVRPGPILPIAGP